MPKFRLHVWFCCDDFSNFQTRQWVEFGCAARGKFDDGVIDDKTTALVVHLWWSRGFYCYGGDATTVKIKVCCRGIGCRLIVILEIMVIGKVVTMAAHFSNFGFYDFLVIFLDKRC